MEIVSLVNALIFGIVEGITEWLPISSTGHMILLSEIFDLGVDQNFYDMFEVVIQLSAVLAVPSCFRERFSMRGIFGESGKDRRRLWWLIIIATLPSAVIGFLFDDLIDSYLFRPEVVAAALIIYGVGFILVERRQKEKDQRDNEKIEAETAIKIGLFQTLALIPGTSRSGATMLGGAILGLSRRASAEFSFLLAIPTMVGASLLRGFKYFYDGNVPSIEELIVLLVGAVSSYIVSVIAIRFLIDFVKRRGFCAFGVYRIILGIVVLLYYILF